MFINVSGETGASIFRAEQSSPLKIEEEVGSTEMSVKVYQTIWRHIPSDCNLLLHVNLQLRSAQAYAFYISFCCYPLSVI
jgi:hypothetical protein